MHAELPRVVFAFTSPQFIFESGTALIFCLRRGPDPSFTTVGGESFDSPAIGSGNIQLKEFDIRDGETRSVEVAGAGRFQVFLTQLKLVRKTDRRRIEIGGMCLTKSITPEEIRTGRITLVIDAPQILVVRVQDSSGSPVLGATVSICMPSLEGSMEQVTNEKGEIAWLGIAGHYHVAALTLSNEQIRTTFEIKPNDSGKRIVILSPGEKEPPS